jgi:hypothetical protein
MWRRVTRELLILSEWIFQGGVISWGRYIMFRWYTLEIIFDKILWQSTGFILATYLPYLLLDAHMDLEFKFGISKKPQTPQRNCLFCRFALIK